MCMRSPFRSVVRNPKRIGFYFIELCVCAHSFVRAREVPQPFNRVLGVRT